MLAAFAGPRSRGRPTLIEAADRGRHRRRARESAPIAHWASRDPLQRPRPLRGGADRGPAGAATTRPICSSPIWALPELIEAATRTGRTDARRRRARAARRGNARQRHRLGAGDRGPLAGAAERGRGRRAPLPRSDRAAAPHAAAPGACPRAPALRRVAAPRGPAADAREQLRTAHEHARRDRHGGVRRARPPRAAGHRREGAQTHRRDAR